jgi:hypothetical protein
MDIFGLLGDRFAFFLFVIYGEWEPRRKELYKSVANATSDAMVCIPCLQNLGS